MMMVTDDHDDDDDNNKDDGYVQLLDAWVYHFKLVHSRLFALTIKKTIMKVATIKWSILNN